MGCSILKSESQIRHLMRMSHSLKGTNLQLLKGTVEICQLFIWQSKKHHKQWYLIWFIMKIPKWGLPFLYLLYLVKKQTEKHNFCEVKLFLFKNSPVGP
jgi:hypothetical protein